MKLAQEFLHQELFGFRHGLDLTHFSGRDGRFQSFWKAFTENL